MVKFHLHIVWRSKLSSAVCVAKTFVHVKVLQPQRAATAIKNIFPPFKPSFKTM